MSQPLEAPHSLLPTRVNSTRHTSYLSTTHFEAVAFIFIPNVDMHLFTEEQNCFQLFPHESLNKTSGDFFVLLFQCTLYIEKKKAQVETRHSIKLSSIANCSFQTVFNVRISAVTFPLKRIPIRK